MNNRQLTKLELVLVVALCMMFVIAVKGWIS